MPRRSGGTDFHRAVLVRASGEDAGGAGSERLHRLQLPYVEAGPGDPIRRKLPGELLGLVVLVGPDSGEIRVSWDGHDETGMLFDEYCWYHRLTTYLFERRCLAGSEVTIELTDSPVDRSQCHRPIADPDQIDSSLKLVGYMMLSA